jgi:hypothetical protein
MTTPSFGPSAPFPDCQRLDAAIHAIETEMINGKARPERPESPYRTFALSSRWELHADGREYIDGVEVRPSWWRRWLQRRRRP